ncbi:MraY family glycosyltransferase [Tundrisphaera lichenicola]|uniref:MraY family glycosyltransferase n=1 Tax=Tundrisphaera lichenicola TaxID=2029860 RepID=UPI003EBE5246
MTLPVVALVLVVASFGLSALLCSVARVIAPRFGLVDRPGGRKAHRAPTPMAGGVAIWLTVASILGAGALALGPGLAWLPPVFARHAGGAWARSGQLTLILGLATAIMAMGLADDRFGLGWKLRLGVQIMLSATLVASGVRVTLFGSLDSPIISGAVTVLWIVGLTNSFNFLDNMDGLAAGVGLIAASLFAAAQVEVEGRFVPAVLLVLVGALAGFLVHNRYPARLFMGDAGSNFLGFLLGALTVVGTFTRPEKGYSPLGVLAPLLVMAVPLYDTTSVILIRIREGRSPFEADRCHFSHRLVERGLTPPMAVRTIYLVTLAGGLGALLLPQLDLLGAGLVVAQTICLLGVVALLEMNSNRPERRDVDPRPTIEASPEDRTSALDGPATGVFR